MKKMQTAQRPVDAEVRVPGSKSITQRALVAAALAEGESLIHGPLASEDTEYTAGALARMGIGVDRREDPWRIKGSGGRICAPDGEIYLGNNGTATRILTSIAALGRGRIVITGNDRLKERPILPLVRALRGWGVEIDCAPSGCPPVEINADGIDGGVTTLAPGLSSQYVSSLLLAAPCCRRPCEIRIEGEVLSRPYVRMTLKVMEQFGARVEAAEDLSCFRVEPCGYQARDYRVEGDASGASYFWAAAAVTGGRVRVKNVPAASMQGDAVFVDILARMGCRVEKDADGITVSAPQPLQGIEVDMGDCPDVVPTLAVVAAVAGGDTRITNIAHLRVKECDRLAVMAGELSRVGIETVEGEDYLVVRGCGRSGLPERGTTVRTHDDHRIAMSFAVLGLAVPGMAVDDPGCVAKSFPDFWDRFSRLG